MSRSPGANELGRGIATVLRIGALLTVAGIGVGFVLALADGEGRRPGPTPLLELVGGGGADALIGLGLLGFTLIPIAALAVAAVALARSGERTRAMIATAVTALLCASLAAAAVIGGAS